MTPSGHTWMKERLWKLVVDRQANSKAISRVVTVTCQKTRTTARRRKKKALIEAKTGNSRRELGCRKCSSGWSCRAPGEVGATVSLEDSDSGEGDAHDRGRARGEYQARADLDWRGRRARDDRQGVGDTVVVQSPKGKRELESAASNGTRSYGSRRIRRHEARAAVCMLFAMSCSEGEGGSLPINWIARGLVCAAATNTCETTTGAASRDDAGRAAHDRRTARCPELDADSTTARARARAQARFRLRSGSN